MGYMTELFFSFGGHNYAHYLPWFDVFLANVETTHSGAIQMLNKEACSVACLFIPGNRFFLLIKLWKKHSCDLQYLQLVLVELGSLLNYGAYQPWIRTGTTSERSKYYEITLEMTGKVHGEDSFKHGKLRDLSSSEIRQSGAAVHCVNISIPGIS